PPCPLLRFRRTYRAPVTTCAGGQRARPAAAPGAGFRGCAARVCGPGGDGRTVGERTVGAGRTVRVRSVRVRSARVLPVRVRSDGPVGAAREGAWHGGQFW